MFQRQQPEVTIAQLAEACGYDSFGGWITAVKKKYSLTQDGIARAARRYFEAASLKPLISQAAIGRLERNDPDRYPRFRELEPFYRTLVERGGLSLPLSVEDRELYLYFARKRIEERQRKERLTPEAWQLLADRLLQLTPDPKSHFHLVRPAAQRRTVQEHPLPVQEEDPNSRRKRAIQSAKDTDLRLFLEREEWVEHMLTYPEMTPQMKVVIVQAGKGAGKSYAAAFLLQHLDKHEHYFLIPYLFEAGESKTADDYLEEFLSTILADLTGASVGDEGKQRPLEALIDHLSAEVRKRAEKQQKIIFVLDNAHLIFPNAGAWPAVWSLFLGRFARDSHSATMYLFTRVWPGWDHPLPFVERTDLPALSLAAAVSIWHHFGFGDVPEETLEKISARCGCNPQLIELLVAHCQSCMFGVRWKRNTMEVSTSAQSPNTQKLEALLSQDSIFETRMDTKTRTVLQSAITSELSHQAKAMLECLACSPLGLPFCLLAEEFANAEDAFNDLVNASLIDLSLAASQRAVLVPFAREAVLLALTTDGRRDAIESRVTDLYAHWLHEVEDFKDDKEEAGLITETIVRYLRQRQLLKATGLFISFGWLCAFFGQAVRIQRVYEEIMKEDRGKDLGDAYEAGRLLFMYQIARVAKKRFDLEACDADYHQIHSLALEGRVVLDPRIEIHLAHTLMERMINENRYQEASDFLRGAFDRIALHKMTSETLAVFLHNKAYLLGRWSRSSSSVDEATRLTEECVTVLHEVVKTLHACLKKALPVQGRYYRMKLAKALQDLAYYLRMLDRLEEAERAIKECLSSWDELKITTSRLLAGPLSEYAQLLLTKGEFENANMMSLRAIELLNPTPQSGDRGMLLVEWAHIFELQGRLPEEKELLLTALPLIVPSRINFRVEAEQRLERIRVIEESSVRYQLDNHRYCQWYQRYLPLEQFDDTAWLAQAGPFTDEEKRKWDELYPERHDAAVWKQLEEIIGCSREREFEQSVALGRLPHIHYPAIDRENVLLHIRDFEALKEEITREENNVVMRRLYLSKIEEQLLILRSVEATYKHDIDALRECNETLFGRISKAEMEVALREFFKMLKQAERHPQARETAEQLLTQLKQWQLSAEDFLSIEEMAEEKHIPEKLRLWSDTPVSWQNVQKLYEDAINTYGFADWCIIPSPDQTVLSLNLGRCEMKLPTNKRYTVLIAVEYLAEEIETHMLRAACGKRSKVALLGSGTRGYLPADEGLAVLAIQEARAAHQLGRKENSWITTLAPGMALGVLTPPQSFRSLHEFLTKAFLVKRLRSSRYETYSAALEAARYDSLYRVSRTFWGIPGHDITGVCKLQDRVYLQGFREVSEKMKTVPIEHLLVGSIGINDLDDMRNLHILEPAIKRQYLSHDPELFERIIALEKES